MIANLANKILRHAFVMFVAFAALRLGAQPLTVLHAFADDNDGENPSTGLLLSGGRLYGGTTSGDTNDGNYESGTIFTLDTNGGNYKVLFSFNGTNGQEVNTTPIIVNGLLYGTTFAGGVGFPNAGGVLFSMNTNGGNFSLLYTFPEFLDAHPDSLQLESSNILCGTVRQTHVYIYGGSIFQVVLDGRDFMSFIATFTDSTNESTGYDNNDFTNGSIPSGPLAFLNGAIFGTTQAVGPDAVYGGGTLYRNGPLGGLTVVHAFDTATVQLRNEGYYPYGGVILVGNELYGTTKYGGPADGGVIFSVNLDADQYTVLRAFTNAPDGAYPNGPLVASGNILYGTTSTGGTQGGGTVFSINLDGSGYTVLHNFGSVPDPEGGNDDGTTPQGSLLLAGNTLYGTCYDGGVNDDGTVWKLNLAPPVTAPQLAITHSGTRIVLTWPTNFTGFTLQSNTSLVSTNWNTVSPLPVTVNGKNTVTNSISGARVWYRLKQ